MTRVNECACLSALIVNETLAQIQHRQIFRGQSRDFIADTSVILWGALDFFICQERTDTKAQTCPGLTNGKEQEVFLPLTDNQCDFNLNHMNQSVPRPEIKYLNENI